MRPRDLSRYRFHTGAPLRRLGEDEALPVLFRDLGTIALAEFVRAGLRRFAGPCTPLLYLRTLRYREPFVDHENTGRLVFLRPRELELWHSGVPEVFVAPAESRVDAESVALVPELSRLPAVAAAAPQLESRAALRELLGGRVYDEACAGALADLERLNRELAEVERTAEPLRRRFQSRDPRLRDQARERMAALGIDEADLCTCWHHIPRPRRRVLVERFDALARMESAAEEARA